MKTKVQQLEPRHRVVIVVALAAFIVILAIAVFADTSTSCSFGHPSTKAFLPRDVVST